MNWQSSYSPGVLGLGAGHYSMDMKGDGFSRGRPGEHPTIPNAPTLADLLGAVTHAGSMGATLATPAGSLPATALGYGARALGVGAPNPPAPVRGSMESFIGPLQNAKSGGVSIGDILSGAFDGWGGGGVPGANLGVNAGAFG